jgi:TatD DNase family protein
MFIDTHAHLNHPDFANDLGETLDRARDAGVDFIIVPATNLQTSLDVIELVQKYNMLYGAVGIHPSEMIGFKEKHLYEIEQLASSEKIVAIGEIGLDYYWKPYDKELEQYVLKAQLQIARQHDLPVIIHNRESSEDLMKIINDENISRRLRGQFHSFSGDMEMAKKCVELGFHISFTGNLTYKPNDRTRTAYEIVKLTTLDNLLLETDSPYLSPVPSRGKRNEPAFVKHTAEKIAELKNTSVEEVARVTCENAKRLFDIE